MALWGGRFGAETQQDVTRYSESISFDRRLFKHDIAGSKAHVKMLASRGIIPEQTAQAVCSELSEIEKRIESGDFHYDIKMEDIHIYGLPGQSCYYNGLSYYSIHKDEYVEIFNKYFNPYGEKITEADVGMTEIYSLAGNSKVESNISTEDSTLNDY